MNTLESLGCAKASTRTSTSVDEYVFNVFTLDTASVGNFNLSSPSGHIGEKVKLCYSFFTEPPKLYSLLLLHVEALTGFRIVRNDSFKSRYQTDTDALTVEISRDSPLSFSRLPYSIDFFVGDNSSAGDKFKIVPSAQSHCTEDHLRDVVGSHTRLDDMFDNFQTEKEFKICYKHALKPVKLYSEYYLKARCALGYGGRECTMCPGNAFTNKNVSVCSGHGLCKNHGNNSDDTPSCECSGPVLSIEEGWEGNDCSSCPSNWNNNNTCSSCGFGFDHELPGDYLCDRCAEGWFRSKGGDGKHKCEFCPTRADKKVEAFEIFRKEHRSQSVACTDRGRCETGATVNSTSCNCNEKFAGEDCSACDAGHNMIGTQECKECPYPERCPGGIAPTCMCGYAGRTCTECGRALCTDPKTGGMYTNEDVRGMYGYTHNPTKGFFTLAGKCHPCPEGVGFTILLVGVFLILVIAMLYFILILAASKMNLAPMAEFFNHVQMMAFYFSIPSVKWPTIFNLSLPNLAALLSGFFMFSFGDVASPQCFVPDLTYKQKWIIGIFIPAFVIFVLLFWSFFGIPIIVKCRFCWKKVLKRGKAKASVAKSSLTKVAPFLNGGGGNESKEATRMKIWNEAHENLERREHEKGLAKHRARENARKKREDRRAKIKRATVKSNFVTRGRQMSISGRNLERISRAYEQDQRNRKRSVNDLMSDQKRRARERRERRRNRMRKGKRKSAIQAPEDRRKSNATGFAQLATVAKGAHDMRQKNKKIHEFKERKKQKLMEDRKKAKAAKNEQLEESADKKESIAKRLNKTLYMTTVLLMLTYMQACEKSSEVWHCERNKDSTWRLRMAPEVVCQFYHPRFTLMSEKECKKREGNGKVCSVKEKDYGKQIYNFDKLNTDFPEYEINVEKETAVGFLTDEMLTPQEGDIQTEIWESLVSAEELDKIETLSWDWKPIRFMSTRREEDGLVNAYYALLNKSVYPPPNVTTSKEHKFGYEGMQPDYVELVTLSIPIFLMYAICVPLGLYITLIWLSRRAKLTEPEYRERFGWVYTRYNIRSWWWFAVIMVRRLSAILIKRIPPFIWPRQEDVYKLAVAMSSMNLIIVVLVLGLLVYVKPFLCTECRQKLINELDKRKSGGDTSNMLDFLKHEVSMIGAIHNRGKTAQRTTVRRHAVVGRNKLRNASGALAAMKHAKGVRGRRGGVVGAPKLRRASTVSRSFWDKKSKADEARHCLMKAIKKAKKCCINFCKFLKEKPMLQTYEKCHHRSATDKFSSVLMGMQTIVLTGILLLTALEIGTQEMTDFQGAFADSDEQPKPVLSFFIGWLIVFILFIPFFYAGKLMRSAWKEMKAEKKQKRKAEKGKQGITDFFS